MPVDLPPKKEVALALLENSTVFIHLDPRVDEVRVPPWFKKQPQLVLQIGLNMSVPIPDLNLDDDSVQGTLSFNRSPFFCRIPWEAVFALVGEDRRGMVWPSDVPPEVVVQVEGQARKEQERVKDSKRAHLRAVPASESAAREPAPLVRQKKKRSGGKPRRSKSTEAGASAPAKTQRGQGRRKKADQAEVAGTSKPARAAKRQQRASPVQSLRAVPAAKAQSKPDRSAPASKAKGAGKPPSGEGKPTKRKLPPYLRVVK